MVKASHIISLQYTVCNKTIFEIINLEGCFSSRIELVASPVTWVIQVMLQIFAMLMPAD